MLLPWIASAQELEVEPTILEAFVANPFVVVEHEQQIGELISLDSAVRIIGVEAGDRSNPGSVVRGVRIDLSNNAWNDSVYLDQDQFTELGRQLRMMQSMQEAKDDEASPFFRPRPNTGQLTLGSEICWMPAEPQRIICPSLHFIEGEQSFVLRVYGSLESFPLNADQLIALSRVIDSAVDQLESDSLFVEDAQTGPRSVIDLGDSPATSAQSEMGEGSQEEAPAPGVSKAVAAPRPSTSEPANTNSISSAIAVFALIAVLLLAAMLLRRRSGREE